MKYYIYVIEKHDGFLVMSANRSNRYGRKCEIWMKSDMRILNNHKYRTVKH